MIRKYRTGNPPDTEAVVKKLEETEGKIPYLTQCAENEFSYRMEEGDIVYGLGESIRGINKRGWVYESYCDDNPNHVEDVRSLYGAHNFFLIDGTERFGVFLDAPQKVRFDVGYTVREELRITVDEGGYVLYLIEGGSPLDIIREFRGMIGRSYIPPKWAFGYGQSRWGYKSESDIRSVAEEYRSRNLPIDMIYMDIDYMERFKDFTVDPEAFPDLSGLAADLKKQGIRLVPIIDAAVKIEEGYPVYEEGIAKGYFCKKEDGTPFVGGVWPGRSHFPDFLNEEVRRWFGDQYEWLLKQGIEGFWNDMNEPAVFYSEDHLREVFEKLDEYRKKNLDVNTFFKLKDLILNLANRKEDYKSFYHKYNGQMICHDSVHNLYGYNMTRAAGEAFARLEPEKRILMFSRASYIGMHRYGGIWSGDNQSWWSHILLNLRQLPGLNMCGFLYTGADLGGFGADTTEDLLLRWMELGIFTPLMRNHSALGTREQEIYRFGNEAAFRNILGLRYALLPYIYSEFMKAVLEDDMLFKPLAFVYPEDSQARLVEDQLLVGESIMIAPVYTQNARGRYVYLPEEMKLYRMRSEASMDVEILPAGHHYVRAELDEVLVFLRPDHLVPLAKPGRCVEETKTSHLKLLHFCKGEGSYELYDDDGYSRSCSLEEHLTKIVMRSDGQVETSGATKPKCTLVR